METIREEFNTRKREIDSYVSFLNILQENAHMKDEIKKAENIDYISLSTMLKAHVLLLLYNLMESTLRNCLCKTHENIMNDGVKYSRLSEHVQKILLMYYVNKINVKGTLGNAVDDVHSFIGCVDDKKIFDVTYEELVKAYQLYSGNLDSKKLKGVLNKYGIQFDINCPSLKYIKDNRNILAHGEKTFEEVGRDLSMQRIVELKNKTIPYMEEIIKSFECYLQKKNYLNNE